MKPEQASEENEQFNRVYNDVTRADRQGVLKIL